MYQFDIPTIIAEGFIALLLLNRLPPMLVSSGLINYLGTGSMSVRELVYPHLMKLIPNLMESDEDLGDYIIGCIIDTEAGRPSADSVLELVYTKTPDQRLFLSLLEPTTMITHGNTDFVLHHIDGLSITPEDVIVALNTGDYFASEVLLRQLFTPVNEVNFKRTYYTIEPHVVNTLLVSIKQHLPALYNWTLERVDQLAYFYGEHDRDG